MKGIVFTVFLVVLLQVFTEGEASECCRPKPGYSHGQVTLNCGDCKPGTPYCGVGRCNIWGCNCDGGCRHGKCDGHYKKEEVLEEADTDHDGKISVEEGRRHLEGLELKGEHLERAMAELGPINDGFLDPSLVESDKKFEL